MDLPTCPACKQSVLDDDAVECPFCGAPMKGGPAPARPSGGPKASPARPTAAKTAPAKSGPAQQGTAVKAAPAAASKPAATAEKQAAPADSDDPFAVDQSATANAIPVSRQQAPGKTLEVICPMCETHGFVSPKAAGKLVKCCNPQCMVPIFTAPLIKKEVPVAPPPPPKKKLPWLYLVGGMVAIGIAAACIVVMNQTGPTELPPVIPGNGIGAGLSATQTKTDENGKTEAGAQADGKTAPRTDVEGPEQARRQIVQDALDRLSEMSRKVPREHKSLYRRLAATAFIAAGDLKEVDVQLDLLEKRGSPSPYEAVLPRAALAWQKQAASPDDFGEEVSRIKRLADKLPKRGRFATEAALVAAPLLVVTGKAAEARQLLADHRSDRGIEQVAAAMQVVVDDHTFNLDTTLPGRTIGDWQAPLEAAVALILVHHGHWDEAFAWSTQSEDPVTRTELTTLWAETYLRHAVPADDATGFERAKKAAEGLPAESQARLLARLSAVKLAAGDRAAAEGLIAQALQLAARISPAKPIHVEGTKPLLDLKLPDPTSYVQTALATAEIAGVQTQLGDADAAWRNVLLSLRLLHGIAPSTSWRDERIRRLLEEPDEIKGELKRALGLKTDDEVRRNFGNYKEKLTDVHAATEVRSFWQGVVLEAAAGFGLLDQVWDELQVLDHKPSIHEREPLLSTALPLLVAARYAAAGNQKKAAEIRKTVEKRTNYDDAQVVKQITEDVFHAGDYSDCIRRLDTAMNSSGVLHEWALRLACRLVIAGRIPDAVAFCNSIRDQALRVDGLFLTGALAARTGHAPEFWKEAAHVGIMESAAACAGLVAGLKSFPDGPADAGPRHVEEKK